MSRRTRAAAAISLLVYAVPVLAPHWIAPIGEVLFRGLDSDRPPAWKAAELALALALQAALFALARSLLARSRRLALVGTVAALVPIAVTIQLALLVAIPSWFLIEADPAPDRTTWAEACSVSGWSLAAIRGGLGRELERRGETWLRSDDGRGHAILRMPDCVVERLGGPASSASAEPFQGLADGSLVYRTLDRTSGEPRFSLVRRGEEDERPIPIPIPPDVVPFDRMPVVAEQGDRVAWIVRSDRQGLSVRIDPLEPGEAIRFRHRLLERATLGLLELDMARRELVIARDLDEFAGLRLDGAVAWGPLRLAELAAQPGTFRRSGESWLGWDAHREDGGYALAWSTSLGRGRHVVPRGRAITAAALDPDGRYVAASTTTALRIGSITDAVFVLATATGAPVWRRTLPTYARSQVAFLGGEFFVFSEIEETGRAEQPLTGRVRVLALPRVPGGRGGIARSATSQGAPSRSRSGSVGNRRTPSIRKSPST